MTNLDSRGQEWENSDCYEEKKVSPLARYQTVREFTEAWEAFFSGFSTVQLKSQKVTTVYSCSGVFTSLVFIRERMSPVNIVVLYSL